MMISLIVYVRLFTTYLTFDVENVHRIYPTAFTQLLVAIQLTDGFLLSF